MTQASSHLDLLQARFSQIFRIQANELHVGLQVVFVPMQWTAVTPDD